MKDLYEKVAKLNEFLHLDEELKAELKPIIEATYDYFCDGIVGYDFNDDGKTIDCHYFYSCREGDDTDWCSIPIKWLEEGCDYKAEFEEMKRKSEEERKRREEEERKKARERNEEAEYETYLNLKKKYEQDSTK